MKKIIRAFIAVSLPEEIVFFLKHMQSAIKKRKFRASFVKPDTIHITLKFIGNIEEHDITKIVQLMEDTAIINNPFSLSTGGVGVFPSIKSARIIWAGIKGDTDKLAKMHRDLEKHCEIAGFPSERKRFSPHITLARIKSCPNPANTLRLIHELQYDISPSFKCNEIHLFKSELKHSGAVHTKIFTVRL